MPRPLAALALVLALALVAPVQAASPLISRVTVSPNPTRNGQITTVAAIVRQGATCKVRVIYARTGAHATSKSLRRREAPVAGTVSWTWKPATSRPGPATASVTCQLGGERQVGVGQFEVAG